MTESQLQQAIIGYLSLRANQLGIIFFAPMNEGVPSVMNKFQVPKQQQYMMMSFMGKMGFLPGVSDIIIGHQGKMYCMELKTETGKQSKGQILFEMNCRKTGIEYRVVRSLLECQKCLYDWGIA